MPEIIDHEAKRPTIDVASLKPPAQKGVKEEPGRLPALQVTNAEFIRTVIRNCPHGAIPVVCSKAGNPQAGGWAAQPAGDVDLQCPAENNNYFNCSTFIAEANVPVLAQKARVAAFHVLMLDDVGTRVELERIASLQPTWSIETSPNNFQVGYALSEPLVDTAQAEALQKAIVAAGLCDPGAIGVVRWARLPDAVNGKPKYSVAGKPFRCQLTEWNPTISYSTAELVAGLGLGVEPPSSPTIKPVQGQHAQTLQTLDEVYSPALPLNPVLARLRETGLYKSELSPGKHDITCPWVSDHTDALDSGACYWEPDNAHPFGGFRCMHSHGSGLHISDLLKHLGVDPAAAQNKTAIRLVPGAFDRVIRAAEEALALTGRIYQFGGSIVAVATDPSTNEVRIEPFSEQKLKRELSKAAVWQQNTQLGWKVVDPPANYVTGLFKAQEFEVLPVLRGLARQPYLNPGGELVLKSGYDPSTGVYGSFDPAKFAGLDTTPAGADAALGELHSLLDEFHFAGEHDRSAAICAILTAVLRPSLPLAPAFNITASSPGSGKSYLADLIAVFATPGQPAKPSYPATSEEATKAILSHLIPGPAVLIFDDMTRDWVAFGSINRMLTSETITDRVLGMSRVQQASTRTLVVGTGNNIEPLNDLRRRVLSLRIQPMVANPALLSYKGRPVERVRADRERFVALVLQIVEAWRKAGSPKAAEFSVASFGVWSDLCREPLLWLGIADPASSLRDQLRDDPDAEILKEFVTAWHDARGEQPTMVRQVIAKAGELLGTRLQSAIADLPVFEGGKINPSKLGWYIKKNSGRILGDLMIEPANSTERRAWRVVAVSSRPPLPPLKEEKGEPGPPTGRATTNGEASEVRLGT